MTLDYTNNIKDYFSTCFKINGADTEEIYLKELQIVDEVNNIDYKSNYFAFITSDSLLQYKDSDLIKSYNIDFSCFLNTVTILRIPIKNYRTLTEVVETINDSYSKSILSCYKKTHLKKAIYKIESKDDAFTLLYIQFFYISSSEKRNKDYDDIITYIPILDNGKITLIDFSVNIDTEFIKSVNNGQEFYIIFKKQDIQITIRNNKIISSIEFDKINELNEYLEKDERVTDIVYDNLYIYIITQKHVLQIRYVFELYIGSLDIQLNEYETDYIINNGLKSSHFSKFEFDKTSTNIRLIFSIDFVETYTTNFMKLINISDNKLVFVNSILPVNVIGDEESRVNKESSIDIDSYDTDTCIPRLSIYNNEIMPTQTFPINNNNYIYTSYDADVYNILSNFIKIPYTIRFKYCDSYRLISGSRISKYIYKEDFVEKNDDQVKLVDIQYSNTYNVITNEIEEHRKQNMYILFTFNPNIENFINTYNDFRTNVIKTIDYPIEDTKQSITLDKTIRNNNSDLYVYILTDNLYYPFTSYRGRLYYSK